MDECGHMEAWEKRKVERKSRVSVSNLSNRVDVGIFD